MRGRGFTLVEVLTVLAVIALLVSVMAPSLSAAMQQARQVQCLSNLRLVGQGLETYSNLHAKCFPPFAFHDTSMNIVLSGHWGGTGGNDFPVRGSTYLNLHSLVQAKTVPTTALYCPSAPEGLSKGQTSYFARGGLTSSYCMRFPYSADLFWESPTAADRTPVFLGAYQYAAGGQLIYDDDVNDNVYYKLPLVRRDRVYRIKPSATAGDDDFNSARDVLVADTFCARSLAQPPASAGKPPVHIQWSHGSTFNALSGSGGARSRADDGMVAAAVDSGAFTPARSALDSPAAAERVWQFLDGN